MEVLTDEEKRKIRKMLKRQSKRVWKDDLIDEAFLRIEDVRNDIIKLKSWAVPDVLTWQDYFENINLIKFVT